MHLFYQPDIRIKELDEEEARHSTKVLRLNTGDVIHVTDGKGLLQKCNLIVQGKKVSFEVVESSLMPRRPYIVNMAVAPTRKAERNEWMIEKMTEIGVERIDFIVTKNTNLESLNRVVNLTRLNRIAAAAMKQSQQFYLPEITLHKSFYSFIESRTEKTRLIAYVPDNHLVDHLIRKVNKQEDTLLLIGPEGDFTPGEVADALKHGFETVSLGATRLRTETAAVAGCHAINLAHIV
jgi:16S rRNA (uracil1498-N3)-methyltransferase